MYQKMYVILFNAITEALRDMEDGESAVAKRRLSEAQCQTENMFMEWDWESGEPED